MDFFFYSHFLEPEPQDVPVTERPEIQDAIERALARKGVVSKYRLEFSGLTPTANPNVQRLNIRVTYQRGSVLPPHSFVIWVDDFELAFRFAKIGTTI
jgi:hypothetical protein